MKQRSIPARFRRQGGGGHRDHRGAGRVPGAHRPGARPVPPAAGRLCDRAARMARRGGGGGGVGAPAVSGHGPRRGVAGVPARGQPGPDARDGRCGAAGGSRAASRSCPGSLLVALVVYGVVLWLGYGLTYTDLEAGLVRGRRQCRGHVQGDRHERGHGGRGDELARKIVDVFAYIAPGVLGMMAVLGPLHGWAGVSDLPAAAQAAGGRACPSPGSGCTGASPTCPSWGWRCCSSRAADEGWKSYLFYAGIDLLLVSQTLFFLQALGVLRWLGAARQWRSGPRVVGCSYRRWWRSFFQFTGLMGLLDTWIDYRKRFALKGSGPGSLR